MAEYVKISVKLSEDVNHRLEELSDKLANGNKSELMRKMLSIVDIYERENAKNGCDLGLVKDGEVEARLIL